MSKKSIETYQHLSINPRSELNGVQPLTSEGLLNTAIETTRKAIDESIALKAEIEQLKSRLRITQLALERQNNYVAQLEAAGKGNCGGDTGAGLFKRHEGRWVQMPKEYAGVEGVIILYYPVGWGRK